MSVVSLLGENISSTTPLSLSNETIAFCGRIFWQEIGVRIYDVAIFIPNLIFLIFLIYKFKRIQARLASKPVKKTFYILVYLITGINLLRCVVSFSLVATSVANDVVDKILWLLLKFFLVSAELSVLTFGFLFGHLDSRTSVRRVLVATVSVGFVFSLSQSLLEFLLTDKKINPFASSLMPYSHGGLYFWMATSAIFLTIYGTLCILPLTRLQNLPKKRRFYVYCGLLCVLNGLQVIGVALMLGGHNEGMCVVDLTSYIYFALYTPVVYFTFLRGEKNRNQEFSYQLQKDDLTGDVGYHPHLSGITSPSYDDILTPYFYDSTDLGASAHRPNPLYQYDDQHLDRVGGVLVIRSESHQEQHRPDDLPPDKDSFPSTSQQPEPYPRDPFERSAIA